MPWVGEGDERRAEERRFPLVLMEKIYQNGHGHGHGMVKGDGRLNHQCFLLAFFGFKLCTVGIQSFSFYRFLSRSCTGFRLQLFAV